MNARPVWLRAGVRHVECVAAVCAGRLAPSRVLFVIVTRCEGLFGDAALCSSVRGTVSGMRAAASLDTPRDRARVAVVAVDQTKGVCRG